MRLESRSHPRPLPLCLPQQPKRSTKGQIASETGLAPVAEALLADPTLNPESEAAK